MITSFKKSMKIYKKKLISILNARKNDYLERVGISFNPSSYRFSLFSRLYYILFRESPGRFFFNQTTCNIESFEKYVKISCNGRMIFWPREYSCSAVGYLYDETFTPSYLNSHTYEWRKVKLKPGMTVIDAGACEGFFSMAALEKGCKVIAIELVPLLCDALSKTFETEINSDLLEIHTVAISSYEGAEQVEIDFDHIYASKLQAGPGASIPVSTIDKVVCGKHIDFIKMDIEGAEVDAIIGAKNVIMTDKPILSIAVYHGLENARQIARYLKIIRPDYIIHERGIFADDGVPPRPVMLYAW